MDLTRLFKILVGASVFLLLFSFIWPMAIGGKRAYSEQDAVELQEAMSELHMVAFHSSKSDNNAEHPEHDHAANGANPVSSLAEAEKRLERAKTKRNEAKTRGQTTATIAKWLAILCAASGVVVFVVMRNGGG